MLRRQEPNLRHKQFIHLPHEGRSDKCVTELIVRHLDMCQQVPVCAFRQYDDRFISIPSRSNCATAAAEFSNARLNLPFDRLFQR